MSISTTGFDCTPNISENESLLFEMEEIVLKAKRNLIVKDIFDLRNILITTFSEKYINVIFIEINIFVNENRSDCIDQIIQHIKDATPNNVNIKQQFEKLFQGNLQEIHKDEIFYSIFDELISDQNHVVLIIENFNHIASHICDNDYHRLIQVCRKRHNKTLNFILVLENTNKIPIRSYKMNNFISTFICEKIPTLNSLNSDKIVYQPINYEKMNKPEVFISYAWTDESEAILKDICIALDENDISYRFDKKDIDYKGNIRDFEERLGKGDYIILIISDKYLKSKNCMYELLKIKESGSIYKRIFPIVLPDTKLYNPIDRIDYIAFWEDHKNELNLKLKKVGAEYLKGLRFEIDNYSKFREIIDDIITMLSEMNNLSHNIHTDSKFSKLIYLINNQVEENNRTTLDEKIKDDRSNSFNNRQIKQYGNNSIYIESVTGDINISKS